jgi:LysM repeat protein
MVSKIDGGSSVVTYPTGPDSNTATVREGDTVSSVASRHNVSDKQLLESNPQIKDSKNLSPGIAEEILCCGTNSAIQLEGYFL